MQGPLQARLCRCRLEDAGEAPALLDEAQGPFLRIVLPPPPSRGIDAGELEDPGGRKERTIPAAPDEGPGFGRLEEGRQRGGQIRELPSLRLGTN